MKEAWSTGIEVQNMLDFRLMCKAFRHCKTSGCVIWQGVSYMFLAGQYALAGTKLDDMYQWAAYL